MKIRVLSIRQPWAWLICNGLKSVENRTWATDYRGPILVHTGLARGANEAEYQRIKSRLQVHFSLDFPPTMGDFPKGGIIGFAEIIDCVTKPTNKYDLQWWERDPFAFILDNVGNLPFYPMKGKLNLFSTDYPEDIWKDRQVIPINRENPFIFKQNIFNRISAFVGLKKLMGKPCGPDHYSGRSTGGTGTP